MGIALKILRHRGFPILANFVAFLDHTKKDVEVRKFDGSFDDKSFIFMNYMPETTGTPNFVALPIF